MTDPAQLIDGLKARGADRFEPVRFRFIEALARRASAQQGDARRLLDARLRHLLATHAEGFAQAAAGAAPSHEDAADSPLAELIAQLARQAGPLDDGDATELKTLRESRGLWSRLSADRRLTQSLAKVPTNAGPLNSQHLVHQALSLMREVSPAYLERFIAHVDALLWLDQVQSAAAPPAPEGRRKTARGKTV